MGKNEYATILANRVVYFATENTYYEFSSTNGVVSSVNMPTLSCQHEEADSRIIWHALYACTDMQKPNIVVRSTDTDGFILLLFHQKHIEGRIWMDAGISSNNTRRYIDINNIADTLGTELCDALPAFHAFTGCDYTASFLK